MNYKNLQHKIEILKDKKQKLNDEIYVIHQDSDQYLHEIYQEISIINEDISNKFFKESNRNILFNDRLQLSIISIKNEIRTIESYLDIIIGPSDDIDNYINQLEILETKLNDINEQQSITLLPIYDTNLYKLILNEINKKKYILDINFIENSISNEFKRLEDNFHDNDNQFNDIYHNITNYYDNLMLTTITTIDKQQKENLNIINHNLEIYGNIMKDHINDDKIIIHDDIDQMFHNMLTLFIDESNISVGNINEEYIEINPTTETAAKLGKYHCYFNIDMSFISRIFDVFILYFSLLII